MKTHILFIILAIICFVGMFVFVLSNYVITGLIIGLISLVFTFISLIKTLCQQNND